MSDTTPGTEHPDRTPAGTPTGPSPAPGAGAPTASRRSGGEATGRPITKSALSGARGRRWSWLGLAVWALVLAFLLIAPFVLDSFWLQVGCSAMAAMIGALGLNLVTGWCGQLSLAHSFFLAVGAYMYAFLSGEAKSGAPPGLGLPPLLAVIGAVATAGLFGLLFSPISGRLKGIYLGVASLGLVFLGEHILESFVSFTGGFNGRDARALNIFGFDLADKPGEVLVVLGYAFRYYEKLWYVAAVTVVAAYLFYRNVHRGRPGRAMFAVRDGEIAAGVLGVNVARVKALAFMVSSMYAGLAGVILALTLKRVVPSTFGLALAVDYLAMIVIGGLGSVGAVLLGALFVDSLPRVLQHYAGELKVGGIELIAPAGSSGITANVAAKFAYGLAVILVLLFEPGGLSAIGRRLFRRHATEPTGTDAAPRTGAHDKTDTYDKTDTDPVAHSEVSAHTAVAASQSSATAGNS